MARSREYEAHIEDVLSPLGNVRVKRMFGGAGVFRGDTMFALISDEQLYFKADEALAAELEAAGSTQFSYDSKRGQRIAMSYWLAPEGLFDEPDALMVLARRAADGAAQRKARRKPVRGRARA